MWSWFKAIVMVHMTLVVFALTPPQLDKQNLHGWCSTTLWKLTQLLALALGSICCVDTAFGIAFRDLDSGVTEGFLEGGGWLTVCQASAESSCSVTSVIYQTAAEEVAHQSFPE